MINSQNGAPIEFVNIGIQKKGVGVITNLKGEFKLTVPDSLAYETLTFSCIGFKPQYIPINSFRSKQIVALDPNTTILNEVKINAKPVRENLLGITAHNPFLSGMVAGKEGDIIEVARVIALKNKETKILSAHIYLIYGTTDSGTFRLNFYYLKDGKPDSLAINKSIVRTNSLKKGWLTIDVSKDEIYLNKDFAFAFEYLPTGEKLLQKNQLMYGGKLGGSNAYSRTSSQGEWKKVQGAAYTMYLKVKQ